MKRIYNRFLVAAFLATILVFVELGMPPVFAATKYERVLEVVSGSNSDLRVFYYGAHTVAEGLALDISMMAAIDPNVWSFSKTAFAVSLGSGWTEVVSGMAFDYTPFVSNMWVKVEGDSNFRISVGGIADNAGTGTNCTISWEVLLGVLETILPYILKYLVEQPPQKEWQSDLHWAEAIVRANPPRITNPSPHTSHRWRRF